ncbi:MAG: tetratricopeptide repeat protein [Candidatus Omnitrophota bacterium]
MKKTFIVSMILIVLGLTVAMLFFQKENSGSSVQPIGEKGISVGSRSGAFISMDAKQKPHPETLKEVEDYKRDIKAIDDAWANIRTGSSYFKNGDYAKAAEAYEKAYVIGGGIKHVSGFDLADVYEKLGRYDDAVTVLDNMIKNRETNEYGIQKASEIRTCLLAAKAKQQ